METRINILDYLGFVSPTKEQVVALNAMSYFVKEENTKDFLTLCEAGGMMCIPKYKASNRSCSTKEQSRRRNTFLQVIKTITVLN